MKNLKVDGKRLDAEAIKKALYSGDTDVLKAEIVSRLDEMVRNHCFALYETKLNNVFDLASSRRSHTR